MITVRSLSVTLSSCPILHDVTFEARAGDVTAIVGPSGSGKSTLLKALSGEIGYRGEIAINDHDLRKVHVLDLAAMRGVLPQSSALAFPFTVDEVVALGLAAGRNARARDAGLRVAGALRDVGLEGYGGRVYLELSGGEQQRVQLARVLCQIPAPQTHLGPSWLLLDEPVSSLDIHHQLTIMDLARRFADAGGGVIAVMHDLNLTALYADRLAAVKAGRLLACGPVASVMTDEMMETLFSCPLKVNRIPAGNTPFVLPHTAMR